MEHLTREKLIEQGYISIGQIGQHEWLIRNIPRCKKTTQYYALDKSDIAIWRTFQTIDIETLQVLLDVQQHFIESEIN